MSECETKGCQKQGRLYYVAWREHGIFLCDEHAKMNEGIISQGQAKT
jgi:hypothetical protein